MMAIFKNQVNQFSQMILLNLELIICSLLGIVHQFMIFIDYYPADFNHFLYLFFYSSLANSIFNINKYYLELYTIH